ncbi:MAG: glycosyltransferase [Patescibacteria group bacterium]|nr:glycosyltransferase [Patescibacteria group bacterium]
MGNRTLIFGTSYVGNYTQLETFALWAKVTRKLNPDTNILVVDSGSPLDLHKAAQENQIQIFHHEDNIGHLNATGKDGWGRAFTTGIQSAFLGEYDWIAALDCDLIFAKPVGPVIEKLARTNIKVAMPIATPFLFTETALCFASVPYLEKIDFIGKYDWQNPPRDQPFNIPEVRCEKIFADDLFVLLLRGYRGHGGSVTWGNWDRCAAYGLDWLHAVPDMGLYRRMLRMNGVDV